MLKEESMPENIITPLLPPTAKTLGPEMHSENSN